LGLAIELFHYVNAGSALLLAALAGLQVRNGERPGRWGAAAFVALAVALAIAAVADEDRPGWALKLLICALVVFPYLLLRFAASFRPVPAPFERVAAGATAGIVAATVILPALPDERPAWALAYLVIGAVVWTAISLVVIVRLWRGGSGQPTLARRRLRLMSGATAGINVFVLVGAADVSEGAAELPVQALLLLSLVAFAVGFAPPTFVRLAWRQPEQEALRHATEELVRATTVSQVTDTLLPHVARIVGGSGAAVRDQDGRVVASYGNVSDLESRTGSSGDGAAIEVVPLSPPFGALVVATSALTPFFGREEVGLLHALGAFADISLARCTLAERERETQAALREATAQAEQANMAKSDFLSRMSHELRTPLNVVLGFGQILEMRGNLDERDRNAVESILKAGRHLLELINEVLDLSRIESGRMAISPEPVELADLASEALDLIRPLAEERSVRLTAELGPCESHVTADRQRLKQVLLNLLSNAVKYNRDGGQVAISCRQEAPGRLRLQVADTGPGIPAAMMDRLFEPFERLGAEERHVEGTGLGLALSRQLVHLMNGEIGAESHEGEGSTFWIELPIASAPPRERVEGEASHERRNSPAAPVRKRRVLLVEDNLANLKLIEALVSDRADIEMVAAMTGRLGLELAREHALDLILLDQHLPDVTGVELLHRLKAHPETRGIPVVVVSADATAGQIRRMRELGAVDYVTKPLDVSRFLRVLDGIFETEGRGW
jgi:signal transduction histidine kinase/ActR/RegA family two-component response regulator